MRTKLTLFMLLLGGAIQAQTNRSESHLPEWLGARRGYEPAQVRGGIDARLDEQYARKTSGTAYRLTGYSRYDHDEGRIMDSSRYEYSAQRGSYFFDEFENLNAPGGWHHSRPDRYVNLRDESKGGSGEVANVYDAANQITETITRMEWGTFKMEWNYDAAGRAVRMLQSDSSDMGWQRGNGYYYRYNAAGLRTQDSIRDEDANEFVGIVRYHYDAAGNQDTMASLHWNGSELVTDYMYISKYGTGGRMSEGTSYFMNESRDLVPAERFSYVYDAVGKISMSTVSAFYEGAWLPQSRDTIGYTGSKSLYTYRRTETWDLDALAWTPLRSWRYALDGQERWSTEYYDDAKGGALVPESMMTIAYSPAGLVTIAKGYRYDAGSGGYEDSPFEEDRFYYESYQTTDVRETVAGAELRLWPNPAGSELMLASRGVTVKAAVALGANGQRIAMPVQRGMTQQFDVSALPAGVYFLQVWVEGQAGPQSLRFVKR